MAAQKYCLALDLKEDKQLVEEYKVYHQKVWPEVIENIKNLEFKCLIFMVLGIGCS